MRIVLVLALVVLLATTLASAAKPKVTPKPAVMPNPTVAALSKLSGQAFDVAFMRELIPVHEEAVEIALAATLNADHTQLLQWNQVMIDRKSNQVKKMLTWLQEAGASPGRRAANVVSDPVKKMRSLGGAALEQAYLPMMALRLEHGAELGSLAATKASKPEVRSFAAELMKVEKQEAAMLRTWLKQWYNK
ncbi:MAG: DUF305 domain-containing protein [Armatimonadota bacterium]